MNAEKREAMMPHLSYEFAMMEQAGRYLIRNPRRPDMVLNPCDLTDEELAYLAILEAFLLHTRLLKEFLFGTKRHPQGSPKPRHRDVRAGQFMPPGVQWPPTGLFFTPQLEGTIDYANKYLMHLDLTRSEQLVTWNIQPILGEMMILKRRFMEVSGAALCPDLPPTG